ncbi:uncharacterized protein LOC144127861 [Amblyomma americanum]
MAPPLSKPDRSHKRVRTEDISIQCFRKTKESFPKFHVLHSEETEKSARTMSPFLVSKCLTDVIGPGYKLSKMPNGDLLLELKDIVQYSKLSNQVQIGDNIVSITAHRSLNTVRGVISETDFIHLTEEEMLEGLKDQNVINVHRIKIRKEDKEIPTKHIVLTFNCSTLPESIEAGYLKINVRHYIPNPRRCFNCQRYGHGSQSCRGHKTCAKCASKDHASENCEGAAFRCANCGDDHPAYSRSCQTWKNEKDIITMKTKQNITFKEARRLFYANTFTFSTKTTFADVVRRGGAPHSTPASAKATLSEPMAEPPTPQAETAKAALSSPKQGDPSNGSASRRTSPQRERPKNQTPAASRSSSTSLEVMDITPSPSALKRRNSSVERKKRQTPNYGPRKVNSFFSIPTQEHKHDFCDSMELSRIIEKLQ